MNESARPMAQPFPAPRHLRKRPLLGEIRDWQLPRGGTIAGPDTSAPATIPPVGTTHRQKRLVALGIVTLIAMAIPALVFALIVAG